MVAANPSIQDWQHVYPGQVIDLPLSWADPNAEPPAPGDVTTSRPAMTPRVRTPSLATRPRRPVASATRASPPATSARRATVPARAAATPDASVPASEAAMYTLRKGDVSGTVIAKRFGKGAADVPALVAANPGYNWRKGKVGDVIALPAGWSSARGAA